MVDSTEWVIGQDVKAMKYGKYRFFMIFAFYREQLEFIVGSDNF